VKRYRLEATLDTSRSRDLFAQAEQLIPGGVNSPVRAFRAVGGGPLFIGSALGSHVYDQDGNDYIDYVASWGPMILGHANNRVLEPVREALCRGTSYGAPTEIELLMARAVAAAFPSIEKVRMTSSGTEATMSALRLARGFTRRDVIVKFEGCYHGHEDAMLVAAGSGVATLGLPDSPGVPAGAAKDTVVLPYNDLAAVEGLLEARGEEVAAVIVEPVAGNMGVVEPAPGFLEGLRRLTAEYGALLIFDEVITGFRVALGGAQERFGIAGDLTCLGKIIGGGFPVGAFGGRAQIMDHLAPVGSVYQAGTLSGNPIAMTAGLATIEALREPGTYELLESLSARLAEGLGEAAAEASVPVTQTRVGSMQSLFFTSGPVADWAGAKGSDTDFFSRYFKGLLARGIYVAPSQFEATFVGLAHTEAEIDRTVEAAGEAMREAKG
jgi:glutamate-1-semialdehyde 2,1-aminomutase